MTLHTDDGVASRGQRIPFFHHGSQQGINFGPGVHACRTLATGKASQCQTQAQGDGEVLLHQRSLTL